jgi:hypothetical protein
VPGRVYGLGEPVRLGHEPVSRLAHTEDPRSGRATLGVRKGLVRPNRAATVRYPPGKADVVHGVAEDVPELDDHGLGKLLPGEAALMAAIEQVHAGGHPGREAPEVEVEVPPIAALDFGRCRRKRSGLRRWPHVQRELLAVRLVHADLEAELAGLVGEGGGIPIRARVIVVDEQ